MTFSCPEESWLRRQKSRSAKRHEEYFLCAVSDGRDETLKLFSYFFILTAPLTVAAKKRLVKGVLNWSSCRGAGGLDLPEVSRLCLYLCSVSTPAEPGGCPGKIPEKLISVFILTTLPTEAAKKRLVKGGLIYVTARRRGAGFSLCLQPMSLSCFVSTPAGSGGCPGKMPEKVTSVFIITAPLTEAAKKRGWLRVV